MPTLHANNENPNIHFSSIFPLRSFIKSAAEGIRNK
jgi:hypothetical protein